MERSYSHPATKETWDQTFVSESLPCQQFGLELQADRDCCWVQLQSHMSCHGLYPVLQSAYRYHHGTETGLLKTILSNTFHSALVTFGAKVLP